MLIPCHAYCLGDPRRPCALLIDHDGPHMTGSGLAWHDPDDMDGGVTAALIEKEVEPTDVWRRRAEKAEDRADDAHNLIVALRADLAATEARAEQVEKERDEALRALGEALESHDETLRDIASGKYAAESRPLTPDAITLEEQYEEGLRQAGRGKADHLDRLTVWLMGAEWAGKRLAPARPEGAVTLAARLDEAHKGGGDVQDEADRLYAMGVRVVGEEQP